MKNYDNRYLPTYAPDAVQYMRDELTEVGFEEIATTEKADQVLTQGKNEVVLLVINSVCGCAAGSVRPGVALALQHRLIPDHLVTAFAGQDKQVVEYIRQSYLTNFLPSSPCIALFKNGHMIHILERKDLVNYDPEEISSILTALFDKHCNRVGPSVNPDKYNNLAFTVMCSTTIPKFEIN
jgi:putative YphP/YqiW family bacilliredoxin